MKTIAIDTTKLLGFNLKGEPIFDIIVPAQQSGVETRGLGTSKADGAGKHAGIGKSLGGAKLSGEVKT